MSPDVIQQLERGEELASAQISAAIEWLTSESAPAGAKADFLAALSMKGETPGEIIAFARELRQRSLQPALSPAVRAREILDVCGTGGDQLNTFNISTTVSILAAAAGVTVAKHGNRAVTSQSGSADVLEALGIPIELPPEAAARWLERHRFAFFFAPRYHPAFRHIAPARKLCSARGTRTIFNFLGPLLNPARPTVQLIGVPRPQLCPTLASALQQLGATRGMVVCGKAGDAWLDELSPVGETQMAQFDRVSPVTAGKIDPADFPVRECGLADLRGGNARENAQIVRSILAGEERGAKRDAVLLNTAAALFVAGRAATPGEGWKLAADVIDRGDAKVMLDELIAAGALERAGAA